MSVFSPQSIIARLTSNSSSPSKPSAYGFSIPLVNGIPQIMDLKTVVNLNVLQGVQGIWIDNSANTNAVTVSLSTFQNLTIPGGYQGCSPLFLSADQVITWAGSGTVPFVLVNFQVPLAVWPATAAQFTFTGGRLVVTDPTLDALAQTGGLGVIEQGLGQADTVIHRRYGKAFTGNYGGAIGTTTLLTGSPSCFVTALYIQPMANSTITGGGRMELSIQFTNAGVITLSDADFPTAAPTVTYQNAYPAMARMENLNLVGSLSGDSVTMTISNGALASGGLLWTLIGGTTGVN